MAKRTNKPKKNEPPGTRLNEADSLRSRLLAHFQVLRIPLDAQQFDAVISQAEQQGWSHLQFLEALIGQQANARRERRIERRIREACFHELLPLETFDWEFNAKAIDRVQIEELATGEFIRRGDNLVFVGQSGMGKSRLIQGIGLRACALDYRVRYVTSAELLDDLTASLADQTLPTRLRYYGRFDWLIIDEFGFEKIELAKCPNAASLMFKVIDGRSNRKSTALVTNVDVELWGEYLQDPPLAMALLDRLVDGAIPIKLPKGKSYRASRAKQPQRPPNEQQPLSDEK